MNELIDTSDKDAHPREMFDRITRRYLRSVVSDALIEEHRRGSSGHLSEPLARLLAWSQRRPLSEQYAIKAEPNGAFRILRFTGRRGQPPIYVGDETYSTLAEARHGVFLRHISDLTRD
jgi:branched-chain amino acid transport system permease protein